jgi:hypothetical protein
MMQPIIWITVANVIYLLSYSVRDILVLRILTVAGAALLIPYYALQSEPLTSAIRWSLVFIAINLYWIVRLIIERRPVQLTPDEARLRQLSFPSLSPREARDLCAMGVWEDVAAGGSLVGHDRQGGHFSVILRGKGDVIYRNTKVAELGEGQFAGDIDLRADSAGDIDVLMRTATRVMCWPRDHLKEFLARRPDVAIALQRSVGFQLRDLLAETVAKLVGATDATT